MPCERVTFPDGTTAMVCTDRRRRRCSACGALGAEKLCDGPAPAGARRKTCDAPLCARCAAPGPRPDTDYCPAHRAPAQTDLEDHMEEAKSNSPQDAGYSEEHHTGDGRCRSCKAPIFWATINGKPHPVNREENPRGNIVLWKKQSTGELHGRVLKKGEEPPAGHVRRTSHFATCIHAPRHRKEPRNG